MSFVYVDESIHDRGDLIVAALVCSPQCLDRKVADALTTTGFVPGVNEFKSSMIMRGNEKGQELRTRLRSLLMYDCKIATVVCPVAERNQLARRSFELLRQIAARDSLDSGRIFLDQGMKLTRAEPPVGWLVEANCDSRLIKGIQVADCASHLIATMLLSELGIVTKMVPSGETYPEPEVEMAWQHWTWLRYALHNGQPLEGHYADGPYEPLLHPFGLLVSDGCSEQVKEAARQRLGAVWVGCVH